MYDCTSHPLFLFFFVMQFFFYLLPVMWNPDMFSIELLWIYVLPLGCFCMFFFLLYPSIHIKSHRLHTCSQPPFIHLFWPFFASCLQFQQYTLLFVQNKKWEKKKKRPLESSWLQLVVEAALFSSVLLSHLFMHLVVFGSATTAGVAFLTIFTSLPSRATFPTIHCVSSHEVLQHRPI